MKDIVKKVKMRWCVNNFWCRFIYRHFLAIFVTLLLILCANQVIHLNYKSIRSKEINLSGNSEPKPTGCYQIISPFSLGLNNNNNNNVNNNNLSYKGSLWDQDQRNGNRSFNQTVLGKEPMFAENFVPPNIRWAQARYDNRMMIRIYEWVWTGTLWGELMNRFDVCLATQCSVDRIYSIAEVSEKWLGPISLAVYITSTAELHVLNSFIAYMQRCSVLFTQTTSIHLVVPKDFDQGKPITLDEEEIHRNSNPTGDPEINDHPCGQPLVLLEALIKKIIPNGMDKSILYPQNHMRNIARKACGTPWVLMTDVDIIPRPNSSSMLQEFYKTPESTKCSKCAFVLPVFELESYMPYPTTKRELITCANKGLARQFHLKIYRFGHWATNYSFWSKSNIDEEPVRISHPVDNRMNHYEPFYVSSDKIPPHDERFIGYGFTRSSQVLESRVKGWQFFVLTPIYAIHWGLQSPQTSRGPGPKTPLQFRQLRLQSGNQNNNNNVNNPRKIQNSFNQIVYNDFVAELMAKHNISVARSKSHYKSIAERKGKKN